MLIFIFICLRGLKGQKEDFSEIRNWVARDNWNGELAIGKLKEWKQTSTTNNFDHFYIFTIESNLSGEVQAYKAETVLKTSEVIKLKKDMPVMFKYQGVPPKKTAVMNVG
ncbi:TPA: hypothetical protein L8R78_005151 [Klebsiella aerogenes]|nr:hypothetical protein [Klebsiella aerogenes]HBS5697076.1 hypothetical protein [Klebsiella aerogenes]